ncbi:MAG: biopolymer transporter ExbD [Acidobacteriaceae bacterium]|nr:biopolymer transporter ExbD [Acidobacteriaceae bacterium]
MAFYSGSNTGAEINVTPLIDVLLVLLIIFMVIVPTKPRGLDTSVPQAGPAQKTVQQLPPVVLEIEDERGSYRLDRVTVSGQQLEPRLAAELALRSDRVVFVRAPQSLSFQPVATVVALAKRAGAERVALDRATSFIRE